MQRRPLRLIAAVLALALALPAPMAFARYTINCSSNGMNYQYCAANTDGSVRLLNQQSQRPCRQGRDWGYDGGGVWVTNGCRATFEVGGGGGGKNDAGTAIAVAGGLAILGALIANSSNNNNNNSSNNNNNNNNNYNNNNSYNFDNRDQWASGPNVPGWMIGRFSGRNGGNGAYETVSIDPHGNVRLQSRNGGSFIGTAGGNSLQFPDFSRSIQPARGGVVIDGSFYSRS